jgi:hypothetical protein
MCINTLHKGDIDEDDDDGDDDDNNNNKDVSITQLSMCSVGNRTYG